MTPDGPPAGFAQAGAAIDLWASNWSDGPEPFVWTKIGDIVTTVKRGRAALDRITESATHH